MRQHQHSSPKPRSAKLAPKSQNLSCYNLGQEQKLSCYHMEKLYTINSSALVPRNCLQPVPSRSTKPKTKIPKNIQLQLGHETACDRALVTTENVTKRGFGIRIQPNISLNHKKTVSTNLINRCQKIAFYHYAN